MNTHQKVTSEGTPYRHLRSIFVKDMGYFYGVSYPNSKGQLVEHPNNSTVTYIVRQDDGHLLEWVFNSAYIVAREYE